MTKTGEIFVLTITVNRNDEQKIFTSAYNSVESAQVAMYVDILRTIADDGFSSFKDIQWHEDRLVYAAENLKWIVSKVNIYSFNKTA